MCGVFGFVGDRLDVGQTVGTALKRLEYRGYDSWGMAWEEDGSARTEKQTGRISGRVRVRGKSRIGIGHTRWATHGGVTSANAHPHLDCTKRIAVVHNGIIENVDELRASLGPDHRIASETDSEVVAHLIEERVSNGDALEEAMRIVFPKLEGFNAVVAIDAKAGVMVGAKRTSPLLVGQNHVAAFITSDVLALSGIADLSAVMEDDTIVRIDQAGVHASRLDSSNFELRYEPVKNVDVSDELSDEPGIFMRREIEEQPAVIARIMENSGPIAALAEAVLSASAVYVVCCGSALNSAEFGRYLLATHGVKADVIPASEFHHFTGLLKSGDLVLAVSQSGETADVMDAIQQAKARGAITAALVNVAHSTLARTVDHAVPLMAGPEQSVLATKSFIAMLARFIQLAGRIAGNLDEANASLKEAAVAIEQLLVGPTADQIERVGQELATHEHVFVLGRGNTWPIARETALKIQEGAYIHAQAFPGGELKHGPLALITEGTPCLVLPGDGESAMQLRSNAQEVKARGGQMIGIGAQADEIIPEWLVTGLTGPAAGLVETVVVQRLALAAALCRGINPDRPRNLAKSVTVK